MLTQLEDYDLALSTTKSVFHVTEVEFLGYIVGVNGVTMSERKVQRIKDWKHPRSAKEVQIFIGFANFYRRFIKDFSKICNQSPRHLKEIHESSTGDQNKMKYSKNLKRDSLRHQSYVISFRTEKQLLKPMQAILHLVVYYHNVKINDYTQ